MRRFRKVVLNPDHILKQWTNFHRMILEPTYRKSVLLCLRYSQYHSLQMIRSQQNLWPNKLGNLLGTFSDLKLCPQHMHYFTCGSHLSFLCCDSILVSLVIMSDPGQPNAFFLLTVTSLLRICDPLRSVTRLALSFSIVQAYSPSSTLSGGWALGWTQLFFTF